MDCARRCVRLHRCTAAAPSSGKARCCGPHLQSAAACCSKATMVVCSVVGMVGCGTAVEAMAACSTMGDGGPRQAVARRASPAQLGGCNSTRHGSRQVTQNTTGAGNGLLGVSATPYPHAFVANAFLSLYGTGTPFQAQAPCALVPIQTPRLKDTGLQGGCQGCVYIFRIAGGCLL